MASQESDGRVSDPAVLTVARFVGVDHCELVVGRVADQMSNDPLPPSRFEAKTTSRPSLRTLGIMSLALVFRLDTAAGEPNAPGEVSRLT